MKDKLILKDGTTIELEAGAAISAMPVLSADKAAMVATWDKLTTANLTEAQVQLGDGTTVGRYTDLVLVSETSVIQSNGSILTEYHLRDKTAEEKRLDALEAGQEVQDGAIIELAAMAAMAAGGDV